MEKRIIVKTLEWIQAFENGKIIDIPPNSIISLPKDVAETAIQLNMVEKIMEITPKNPITS